MSRIEDTLRETFRERVAAPPATDGLADRAIAGARRVRRSRMAAAGLAAVLSVALVSIGVATLTRGPGSIEPPGPSGVGTIGTHPSPTLYPTLAVPVDVVIGDRLYLAEGGDVSLADATACESCSVRGAWRVPDGWLIDEYQVNSAAGTSTLWHVPKSGEASVVVVADGSLLVSPGTARFPGVQVVWVADGRLRIGRYADARVTESASTPAPRHEGSRPLYPQALVGDAVVLAGTQTGGGLDIWDVWFPDRGDYAPAEYPLIAVHTVTADRERLLAWYSPTGSKQGCLGELEPEAFTPTRSRCPSPLWDLDRILLSPGGRWWVVLGMDGLALYEVEAAWQGAGPARTLPPPDETYGVAWIDGESFVVLQRDGSTIVHTDGRPDEPVPRSFDGEVAQSGIVVDLR